MSFVELHLWKRIFQGKVENNRFQLFPSLSLDIRYYLSLSNDATVTVSHTVMENAGNCY